MHRILVPLLTAFLISVSSSAIASGIAGIDIPEIVNKIPQKKAIEDKLNREFGGQIAELKKMEKEMQALIDKGERDSALMSEKQRLDLKRKLEDLNATYKVKGKAFTEDNRRRQLEERDKLLTMIKKASAQVAEREGYDAVVDINVTAYLNPKRDITEKVITEMTRMK